MTGTPAVSSHPAPTFVPILALLAHVGIGLTFYVAAGLLAPLPGIVVLWLLWLALLGALIVLWRRRSWWVLVIPPLAFGVWFGVLSLGEAVFDWRG